MKNYYRILGVLDDAEDVVIRAAYKALAQRYHPDKWNGSLKDVNSKMADINEAYATLSDPFKRKKYDEEFFSFNERNNAENIKDDGLENFEGEDVETWKMAVEFFPNLDDQYAELKKISHALANTFRIYLVEVKDFKNSESIKRKFEHEHFRKYYGEDEDVRQFAKNLLTTGFPMAAIELNKIVRFMGCNVSIEQIRERIYKKFPDVQSMGKVKSKSVMDAVFNKALEKNISRSEAIKIIEYVLDTVVKTNPGFWGVTFSFKKYGKPVELTTDIELSDYAVALAKVILRKK